MVLAGNDNPIYQWIMIAKEAEPSTLKKII
jgi:hypothetical protein